jgi:hypothetical protein
MNRAEIKEPARLGPMINSGEGYGLLATRSESAAWFKCMTSCAGKSLTPIRPYFWAMIKVVPGKVLGISL